LLDIFTLQSDIRENKLYVIFIFQNIFYTDTGIINGNLSLFICLFPFRSLGISDGSDFHFKPLLAKLLLVSFHRRFFGIYHGINFTNQLLKKTSGVYRSKEDKLSN